MSNFPWLTTIGVVPLVGAIVIGCLPKAAAASARLVALVFSLITLGLGIAAATQFKTGGSGQQFQLTETHTWIKQFGVSYALGVDGIALALILMSLVLLDEVPPTMAYLGGALALVGVAVARRTARTRPTPPT